MRRHSGVARFYVHMTPHTCGCRFLESGGSAPALQAILGHKWLATTERYGKLDEANVRAEAERVHCELKLRDSRKVVAAHDVA